MSQSRPDPKTMNAQLVERLLSSPAQPLPDGGYTIRVLEVRGRRSGTVHQTPVGLLSYAGAEWLVSPDASRDWVANVRAADAVTLRAGDTTEVRTVHEATGREAAEAVHAYLSVVTVPWAVAAFGVPQGADADEIARHVDRMAVFALESA